MPATHSGRAHDEGVTPTAATILHVDLDAFFAAVEQRDRPELRGRPVIVGGGDRNARGVVSAASYEARVFGVRSAMPLRTAGALCPQGVFLPVDGAKYSAVSRQVMSILRGFTPLVEPISIDEAFLDVAGTETLLGSADAVARAIKAAIRREVDLSASVGVATTKLVAKVASELRKPDGLVVVEPGTEAAFLAPLPIERLWGVGAKTRAVLTEYGVRTIGDLAALPVDILLRRFGNSGSQLAARAVGIDPSPVGDGAATKSVSHEHTFDVDTADWEVIERTLLALSEGVAGRLRAGGVKAGTVAIRLRDSDFVTISRQRTLKEPTDMTDAIWRTAVSLVRPQVRGMRVRLLGVGASHLTDREQLALFGEEGGRRRRVVEASDAIRERFGARAITRARLLHSGVAAPFERDYQKAPDARRVGLRAHPQRDTRAGTRAPDDAAISGEALDTEHPFD